MREGVDEDRLRAALCGRRVLLTGHTGFKGGWLALWLHRLGAEVVGVALPSPAGPGFCAAAGICDLIDSRYADVRDAEAFAAATSDVNAEIVLHLAAQPIVRRSYLDPVDTFATNVLGVAVVLEAARRMPALRVAIVVTSDKCYENREQLWGYRETDRMGGSDPYSASKGCAELVIESYRRSFFADPDGPQLASARAGNVFGGGDWGEDRLLPDYVRAAAGGRTMHVRNHASVRPWQHVLDPLHGYLALAAALIKSGASFSGPWNFGPDQDATVDVAALMGLVQTAFGPGAPTLTLDAAPDGPPEAGQLRLDSLKARARLGWRPRLDLPTAVGLAVEWYLAHAAGGRDMRSLSLTQIERFVVGGAAVKSPMPERTPMGASM